jgi:hypothetical protein
MTRREFVKTASSLLVPAAAGGQILSPIIHGGGWSSVEVPDGVGWTPLLSIEHRGNEFRVANFDLASLAPTGTTYHVAPTGSDSNDGLTVDTPLRAISTALAKGDVDVVRVAPGWYWGTSANGGWGSTGPTRSVSVIASGPGVYVSGQAVTGSWSVETGSTYKSNNGATIVQVLDTSSTDSNGEFLVLTLRTSIGDVEANPGSWYWANSTLYVRTFDSRLPDTHIRPFSNTTNARCVQNVTMYAEGIDFVGGSYNFYATASSGWEQKLFFKNCTWRFSTLYNGLNVTGADTVYCQNCAATNNWKDGLNYSNNISGNVTKALEIDTYSARNGRDGTETNNGSTSHYVCRIIRVGGIYEQNMGPNVADVGGAQSWNLGCAVRNSAAANSNVNFHVSDSGGAMWLDRVTSVRSGNTDITVASPAVGYVRGLIGDLVVSGVVTPY